MEDLTALEKDTISEVGNISLGASATALSTILDKFVDITTPQLTVLSGSEIQQKYPLPCLLVEVEYISGLQGSNVLLIKEQDALIIAALMMGESHHQGKEGPLSEIELSAVQEAMNQMMGSMSTSMSELFQRTIEISSPQITRINFAEELPEGEPLNKDEQVVHVEFSMQVEDIINSVMVQVIPLNFAKEMTAHLLSGGAEPASGSAVEEDLTDDQDFEVETAVINAPDSEHDSEDLTDLEKDTIAEVGNISLGASATAMATLLNKEVDITTPKLDVRKVNEIQDKYPIPCLLVRVEYTTGLEGSNVFLIKEQDAAMIAAQMMGEPPESKEGPLNEIELSAVQEAMNQMMGSMSTSMSELFQRQIDITPPSMELEDLADEWSKLYKFDPEDKVVQIEFSMTVEGLLDTVMIQIIPIAFAKKMAGYLLYGDTEASTSGVVEEEVTIDSPESDPPEEDKHEPEQEKSEPRRHFSADAGANLGVDMQKLDLVRDIPMDITVVLGTTRVPLGKLFSLDKGGVVDLDCNVNDPVQLLANDKLLAKGEVVMINDQLGVRITEIQFEEVIESYGI